MTFSQNLSRMFAKDYMYIEDSTFSSGEMNFLVAKMFQKQCLDSKWIKVSCKTKLCLQNYLTNYWHKVKKRKILSFKKNLYLFLRNIFSAIQIVFSALQNIKIELP